MTGEEGCHGSVGTARVVDSGKLPGKTDASAREAAHDAGGPARTVDSGRVPGRTCAFTGRTSSSCLRFTGCTDSALCHAGHGATSAWMG